MSLLNKIAISKGNKLRQAAANLIITEMDRNLVAGWNRRLETEIYSRDFPANRIDCTRAVNCQTGKIISRIQPVDEPNYRKN